MKFLKILIKNFKGLKDLHIVDLDKSVTLLTGANGFGKTTIFDAIELCLTGKLHRTEVKKSVTNDRQSYKKPFFQNNEHSEVTLKLWLRNNDGEDLIIVRHLNKDVKARPKVTGKKNKANDFTILDLYTENTNNFNDYDFNVNNATKISQEEVSNFFEFADKDININGIYHIFNYLQQEETTYFLKKSEHERKNSLGFLLQTDIQEEKLNSIKDKIKKLEGLIKLWDNKLRSIEQSNTTYVQYERVFVHQITDFDSEDPFLRIEEKQLHEKHKNYNVQIDKLIKFKEEFEPKEYLLKLNKTKIKSLLIDPPEFKEHYVLINAFEKDTYEKLSNSHKDKNNDSLLEAYILQNITGKFSAASKKNKIFDSIEKYEHSNKEDKEKAIGSLIDSLQPELSQEYATLMQSKRIQMSSLDTLTQSIVGISNTVDDLAIKFSQIQQHEKVCKCPYCGSKFDAIKDLTESLKERKKTLYKLSTTNDEQLQKLNRDFFEKIFTPMEAKIIQFQKENSRSNDTIIQKLHLLQNQTYNFSNIDSLLKEKGSQFKWKSILTPEALVEYKVQLIKALSNAFPIDDDVWQRITKLNTKNFKSAYQFINEWSLPEEYSIKFNDSYLSKATFIEHVDKLSKYLNDRYNNNKFDPAKSSDSDEFFNNFFGSDSQIFESISAQRLKSKKAYINQIINNKNNELFKTYSNRISKLNSFKSKLENLKTVYADEIKKYKKTMIRKIQIPFFIYTAKILQNYQQGMGIFIHVKDDSAIRFIANGESDHDIMHHLSSGQLAVVALAFCLAVNKTFEISPNLKFLAIDDPVQEMDSLNIHSFVDLVKTELSDDYQLIFSTHDYDNALFMKYKLERKNHDRVAIMDVQNKFFPPLSNDASNI